MLKHYHTRIHFSYKTSATIHFYSSIIAALSLTLLLVISFKFFAPINLFEYRSVSLFDICLASFLTLVRLSLSYVMALLVALPLAVAVTSHPRLERFFLPIFDILQSVPVLAFFPVIVLLFMKFNLFEWSAIFILFMSMVWVLIFSMVAGIKTIPAEIKDVAEIFKFTGFKKLKFITIPAIFPYIVTGSLIAWGAGWNVIIVAEAIHTYIPSGTSSDDLFGIGSLLVNSAYQNNSILFLSTLVVMVLIISLMNFFIWQKLLRISERYKFD